MIGPPSLRFIHNLFILILLARAHRPPKSIQASYQRNLARGVTGATSIASILLTCTEKAHAASKADLRESIASAASILPGMGQPDIYYPESFAGRWSTNRNITQIDGSKEAPSLAIFSSSMNPGRTPATYETVFKEYNSRVILDRRKTCLSEALAYSGDGINAIAEWQESNPNILKLVYNTGKNVVVQVSKRSQEKEVVGYSEFGRLIESGVLDMDTTQPDTTKVFTYRILSRLKQVDLNTIVGLERFFLYTQDTLDLATVKDKPILKVKSQITLTRI